MAVGYGSVRVLYARQGPGSQPARLTLRGPEPQGEGTGRRTRAKLGTASRAHDLDPRNGDINRRANFAA
jgi:2,3-bisphosphoglycerate-independent phosphoglycerate mutase